MNDATSEKFVEHLRTATAELARAVQLAKNECSSDEFEIWRARLGLIIGELFVRVIEPLYTEKPALAPEEMRARYPLKPSG